MRLACGRATTGLREGAVRAVPKAATHHVWGYRRTRVTTQAAQLPTGPTAILQPRHTRRFESACGIACVLAAT